MPSLQANQRKLDSADLTKRLSFVLINVSMRSPKFEIDTPATYQIVPGALEKYHGNSQYAPAHDLELLVPGYVELITGYVAGELAFDQGQKEALTNKFNERLAHLSIYQKELQKTSAVQLGGYFDGEAQAIVLSSSESTIVTLPHELVHGLFVRGLQFPTYIPGDEKDVLNGVRSTHYNFRVGYESPDRKRHNGQWINEGLNDHVGEKALGIDTEDIAYFVEVIILRTMFDLVPDLEKELIRAAFITGKKSKPWGMVEDVLGPLWIEEVGEQISTMKRKSEEGEYYDPIDSILRLTPPEIRETFYAAYMANGQQFFSRDGTAPLPTQLRSRPDVQ
jgi:hypothetical protein